MRRRRTRRRKNKQKQIIIISTMCLFLCLCVGYATFQTNITITAKGNVLCSGEDAKDKILADSLGSGIYDDSYETGRYVYRGADVDNYITFNSEPWRIIAIESDGTLKIMRHKTLDDTMAFDNGNSRTTEYCSYYSSSGCNAWAATSNMMGNITSFENGSYSGAVEADSSLNESLNGTYYNGLNSDVQKLIVKYTYNIGGVAYSGGVNSEEYTIENQLADEKKYKWEGYVALINFSDYIKSNSSTSSYCDRAYGNWTNFSTCIKTTWMATSLSNDSAYWWTITPYGSSPHQVWALSTSTLGYFRASYYFAIHPVVHLTSGLKLSGSGTEEDPYVIEDC